LELYGKLSDFLIRSDLLSIFFLYVLTERENVCHHSCSGKLLTPVVSGPNIDIQPSDAD